MRTPAVPSKDVLRYLRCQSEVAFVSRPTCASSIARPQSCRQSRQRHYSTSSSQYAKPQSTFIDDLWHRQRDLCKALPAPRQLPPQPPQTRHASNATNNPWLGRWLHHRQAKAEARLAKAAAKLRKHDPGVPFENQSYEDTSAQLFNLSRALSRNPSRADLKLRCT